MRDGWPKIHLEKAIGSKGRVIGGPFGSDLTQSDYTDSGVPVIRVTNQVDSMVAGDFVFVSNEKAKRLKNNIAKPGDIVVVQRGSTYGKVSRIPTDAEYSEYVVCQSQMAVSVDEEAMSAEYVFQALRSPIFSRYVESEVIQTGQPHINLGILKRASIPLPPLPEQRKIAEILRTWDEALEKLTALRAAKLKRHRGLTMALVFGGWQLERFRKTSEVTPYRWFELPGSWNCQHIGDLATEISERNGEGDQHEVLSCSKHDGFVRSLEYFKKQVFSADLTGYKKIWRGDFGFPSNHVEEGSIGLQNLTDIGVVSPIYTVFRFDPDQVNAEYAFAVLKTELYRHIFEVSTSASVDRRGSLRWSEFSRLPFPVPSLDEQEAIADVLRTSLHEVDALTDEIESVSRQKRGLMQKLLTGEWRVKLEAPVA
ncbi:restriction endonuclease subunit S [Jannaschia formosa]|uniref:restriction endonuclease subunit S n=1 Tax=Jannaschia formosa TaxID=2259592 RepID=UPI000E1BC38C|nr:restriction endonuclease subunit S [Jannaschia formosa]TFL18142.1 restriction endonuclease subunit S [Jannaschia formosa]